MKKEMCEEKVEEFVTGRVSWQIYSQYSASVMICTSNSKRQTHAADERLDSGGESISRTILFPSLLLPPDQ